MTKSLLITLADSEYLESAKQVFSSAYYNGLWQGDFMLLADNIKPQDLDWFYKRNILVIKCEDFDQQIHLGKDPNRNEKWEKWIKSAAKKIYLFHSFFKSWDNIVFLDSDIIVRHNISQLSCMQGFNACQDCLNFKEQIWRQENIQNEKEKYNNLKKIYDFKALAFNSGIMAFSTDIIKENTFLELFLCLQEYYLFANLGDQTILNIYYYKKWKKLPLYYNGYAPFLRNLIVKTATIHPIGYVDDIRKPWEELCPYHQEWKKNLFLAEKLNVKIKPKNPKKETKIDKYQIMFSSAVLKTKISIDSYVRPTKASVEFISFKTKTFFGKNIFRAKQFTRKLIFEISKFYPKNIWLKYDWFLGQTGIFIKKRSPKLYYFLKKLKS